MYKSAVNWARRLAVRRTLEHSPEEDRPGIGENIFGMDGRKKVPPVAQLCTRSRNVWYVYLMKNTNKNNSNLFEILTIHKNCFS